MAAKPIGRRYRKIILLLFRDGECLIKCAAQAQRRVKKMVILEKHIYEKEQNPIFSSEWKMLITLTETTVHFKLVHRQTADRFIADVLTPDLHKSASQLELDLDFNLEEFF